MPVAPLLDPALFARQQFRADGPDLVHLLLADAALEDFRRGLGLAFLDQPDRQLQFGQLAAGERMQFGQHVRQGRVGPEARIDLLQGQGDVAQRRTVRLQVLRAAGQQKAAGTGLGIDDALGQALQAVLRFRQRIDTLQPFDRLPVRKLADEHDGCSDDAGQREHHAVAPEQARKERHHLRPRAIVGSSITSTLGTP